MSIEIGELKERLDVVRVQLDSILKSRKYQLWSRVFVGICFIALAFIVFTKTRPNDTANLDKQIQLRDSIIAAKDQHIVSNDRQREVLLAELTQLKQERVKLVNAYISNQEKHVIINQKKNEINPSLNDVSKDSLRKLFNGRSN